VTKLTLKLLQAELVPIWTQLAAIDDHVTVIRARVDNLPAMGVAIEAPQRDVHLLRANVAQFAAVRRP
jgi:hypothetical protein